MRRSAVPPHATIKTPPLLAVALTSVPPVQQFDNGTAPTVLVGEQLAGTQREDGADGEGDASCGCSQALARVPPRRPLTVPPRCRRIRLSWMPPRPIVALLAKPPSRTSRVPFKLIVAAMSLSASHLRTALKPTAPELVSNNPALLTFAALVGTAGENAFPPAGVDEVATGRRKRHYPRYSPTSLAVLPVKASLTTRCACTLYPPMLPNEGRLRWAKGGEQEWDNRKSRSVRSLSTVTKPRSH